MYTLASFTNASACAIANKAVAEKKIIAIGKRTDGVQEMERRGFLLVGIGDTASRRRVFDLRFVYGKKLLLMLFAIFDVPSTLRPFQRCAHTSYRPRQYLSPTKLTPFRLA